MQPRDRERERAVKVEVGRMSSNPGGPDDQEARNRSRRKEIAHGARCCEFDRYHEIPADRASDEDKPCEEQPAHVSRPTARSKPCNRLNGLGGDPGTHTSTCSAPPMPPEVAYVG